MGDLFVRFFVAILKVYKMARDINMNVFWHDFWSCSISKEDSIRYKWQTKKHLAGIEDGILYTGAEKGKRITYPGRVGTIDLEAGAQKALAHRAAKLKPIVPMPSECRRDSKIKLPRINVPRFCERNGVHAALTIYPHDLRETMKLRKDAKILGEGRMPKRPVFTHLHTVGGRVTKQIDDGSFFHLSSLIKMPLL